MSEVVQAIFKKLSVSNEEMIKKFLTNDYPKDANYPLSTINNLMIARKDDGWNLINYDTPLLINRNGLFFFNNLKYSQSTTIIQNKIKQIARELGIPLIEDNQENGYQDTLKNIDKTKERYRMKNRSIKEIQAELKKQSDVNGFNDIDNDDYFAMDESDFNNLGDINANEIMYKVTVRGDVGGDTSNEYSTEEDARRKYEEAKALSDYVTLSRVDKKSGTEDILEDYNIDHENTEIENVFND